MLSFLDNRRVNLATVLDNVTSIFNLLLFVFFLLCTLIRKRILTIKYRTSLFLVILHSSKKAKIGRGFLSYGLPNGHKWLFNLISSFQIFCCCLIVK